eukprot:CAMPEP_0201564388 /NCGR_PEP_ID=MMETSP0190_2-20130828/2675_1 /ASSEMBLY_ACC=CAM_ASM_000263 /TAXON_ID=37353 /ORGANISM="Rosalina sp." /LENGTH=212 /DNA_ID=CAMNT_0047980525 /DNA_START=1108 /DNA_END=1746 /DNA_ORIENTATION=+
MVNLNTTNDLQKILKTVDQYLKQLKHSPSVQIHPDANRKEYALNHSSKELQKQVKTANNIIQRVINKQKNTNTAVVDVFKDDQLQNKQEIDKYRIDKENDQNVDIRIPTIVRDKMIEDNREFYDGDKDQDKDNNDNNHNNHNNEEMKTMAIDNNNNNKNESNTTNEPQKPAAPKPKEDNNKDESKPNPITTTSENVDKDKSKTENDNNNKSI